MATFPPSPWTSVVSLEPCCGSCVHKSLARGGRGQQPRLSVTLVQEKGSGRGEATVRLAWPPALSGCALGQGQPDLEEEPSGGPWPRVC